MGGGGGEGGASHHLFERAKKSNMINTCTRYSGNKGKPSGEVPHRNFYFVVLLVFLA